MRDHRPTFVREIFVTIGDEIHHGTYFVQGLMVHVQWSFGTKAAQVGNLPPEMIAKMLLSELVRASTSTDWWPPRSITFSATEAQMTDIRASFASAPANVTKPISIFGK
jgi:hypothetical protein